MEKERTHEVFQRLWRDRAEYIKDFAESHWRSGSCLTDAIAKAEEDARHIELGMVVEKQASEPEQQK